MAAFSSRRLSRDCDACLAALIDKTCKNSWKWEWLERMPCGTVACGAFIQKIAQPGKAVCTWCSKEIVYGGRGYKSLESHAESKKHRDIQRIRASNYSLPGKYSLGLYTVHVQLSVYMYTVDIYAVNVV